MSTENDKRILLRLKVGNVWVIDNSINRPFTYEEACDWVESEMGQPPRFSLSGNTFREEFLSYYERMGRYLLLNLTQEELQKVLNFNTEEFERLCELYDTVFSIPSAGQFDSVEVLVDTCAAWMTYAFIWGEQYAERRDAGVLFSENFRAPETLQLVLEQNFVGQSCSFDTFVEAAWMYVGDAFIARPSAFVESGTLNKKYPRLGEITEKFYSELKQTIKAHLKTLYEA